MKKKLTQSTNYKLNGNKLSLKTSKQLKNEDLSKFLKKTKFETKIEHKSIKPIKPLPFTERLNINSTLSSSRGLMSKATTTIVENQSIVLIEEVMKRPNKDQETLEKQLKSLLDHIQLKGKDDINISEFVICFEIILNQYLFRTFNYTGILY